MAPGNTQPHAALNPIVSAIHWAQGQCDQKIQVQLSERFFERNPVVRAMTLLELSGAEVIIYVNLRKNRFAIALVSELSQRLGRKFLSGFAESLCEDLQSTHPENAVAIAVRTLGIVFNSGGLKK